MLRYVIIRIGFLFVRPDLIFFVKIGKRIRNRHYDTIVVNVPACDIRCLCSRLCYSHERSPPRVFATNARCETLLTIGEVRKNIFI